MGFISSELDSTHEDYKLVKTLWLMLGGKEQDNEP